MSTSIYELELELMSGKTEKNLTGPISSDIKEFNFVYDKDSILLTWTGLYKPHRS
jgi:hypothetical protein